jgi:hypothetical protein
MEYLIVLLCGFIFNFGNNVDGKIEGDPAAISPP